MKQFIIVVGDIVDGCGFVGPFDSMTEAVKYAEATFKKETWMACVLNKPTEKNQ